MKKKTVIVALLVMVTSLTSCLSADGQTLHVLNEDGDIASVPINGNGASALDDLSDVEIVTPALDEALVYDGTKWVNGAVSGDGPGTTDHSALSNLDYASAGHTGFAPDSEGVTNGDTHDHAGGDGAQIDHGGLGGLADNDHPQYVLDIDVDDTPVNNATTDPISSNWAYDHDTSPLSATVHNNTTLFRVNLSSDQTLNPAGGGMRVELNAEAFDLGNNFTTADWYGAAGAYRPSDADSSATYIEDDDAAFTTNAYYVLVRWASNAGGTLNTGTGIANYTDADTLQIMGKISGANFASGYYYYIKQCSYVAPVSGYYEFIANIGYKSPVVADQAYRAGILINGTTWAAINDNHASFAGWAMRLFVSSMVHLDAGDNVLLIAYTTATGMTLQANFSSLSGYCIQTD